MEREQMVIQESRTTTWGECDGDRHTTEGTEAAWDRDQEAGQGEKDYIKTMRWTVTGTWMETGGTTEGRRTDEETHSGDTKDKEKIEEDSNHIGNVLEYVMGEMKEI